MTPERALTLLDQAAAEFKGTRADHRAILEATAVLRETAARYERLRSVVPNVDAAVQKQAGSDRALARMRGEL